MHWAPIFSNRQLKILFFTKEVWGVFALFLIFVVPVFIANQALNVVVSAVLSYGVQYIVDHKPRGYLPHLAHYYGIARLSESPQKGKFRN